MIVLAGDIGGTSTRLALYAEREGRLVRLADARLRSQAVASAPDALATFLHGRAQAVSRVVLGVAGPVRDGIARAPNLAWVVDAAEIAARLGVGPVTLLNDVEAHALGLPELPPHDLVTLQAGTPDPAGPLAVCSPGTGLGMSLVDRRAGPWRVHASEGGHADFAPRTPLEDELLAHLRARFPRVSVERVVSGPGLGHLYRFLLATGRGTEPAWLAAEMAERGEGAAISAAALAGTCPLCRAAVELFAACLAAAAGNLALVALATGGVYLGGGIVPHLLPVLRQPAVLEAFRAKGRLRPLMEAMPVHVILNDQTALLGAARHALRTPGPAAVAP